MNVRELVREDKIIDSLADVNYVFEQRITAWINKKKKPTKFLILASFWKIN